MDLFKTRSTKTKSMDPKGWPINSMFVGQNYNLGANGAKISSRFHININYGSYRHLSSLTVSKMNI